MTVFGLTNDQICKAAPSVFAESGAAHTSERYTHIPTIHLVEALRQEGWFPVKATQSASRSDEKRGYAKHAIRFRSEDRKIAVVGEHVGEIVLVNSHDGASSYQLQGGLFRFVCSNGMVVADQAMAPVKVRHKGDVVGNVIDGVYELVEEMPRVLDRVQEFKSIPLDVEEQKVLSTVVRGIRWDEDAPVAAEQLLRPRRSADTSNDLWTITNRLQENVIKGGLAGWTHDQKGRPKRTTTREIRSVGEDIRLNKAIWALAEEMAKLKR